MYILIFKCFLAIKCNKLPQIKFGKFEPISCSFGKQEFGKKCKIICNEGFKIGGPAEKQCTGARGTWDSKFEDTICADNSKLEVSVWLKPSIKSIPEYKFQIGKTAVTYFAQDAFHNRAKCTFYVTVGDDELPTIENCVDPPTFLTSELNGANITWDEPHVYDNSQKVKVSLHNLFYLWLI
ncbi:hypothetical protein NQ314_017804 [Rhamnusium bicolor]|uniref:Sushi domain-containing protein n=1 Tax=Rhamnusium bicolor TaxID=1586634 RepID=A0AAV8WTL8_9CUCU|nr:hypothetical protein NQ314_017804 [Rhamnusium bicolor]